MLTLEQAKNVHRGQELHHRYNRNADGTPERWRVNGKVKTWKRTPSRVEVPLKHGLYNYDYLTEGNMHLLCLTAEEALDEGKTIGS